MTLRPIHGLFILTLLFMSCGGPDGGSSSVPANPGPQAKEVTTPSTVAADDRNALAAVVDPLGESVTKIVYLDQNWSSEVSQKFYYTSQGSQILPYIWFLALEQKDNETPFRDNVNMSKFRYLVQKPGPGNPDGLPVGFVKDDGDKRGWLGLTCAACHTSQINHEGVGYRIDGGGAGSDVGAFLAELTDSLKATYDDPTKFRRFVDKVAALESGPADPGGIKSDLSTMIDRREGYNARNFPKELPALNARIDAFGAIMNEVFHAAAKIPPGDPKTGNTSIADAPVSIPFLWDTPQHDAVQWNGVAKNAGLGSLGRNVGEVLGVFGSIEIPESPSLVPGFKSTVKVRNLLALNEELVSLWSPLWPVTFPAINAVLRDKGKAVFAKVKCDQCHLPIDRTDRFRRIEAQMQPVGTDPKMSDNFSKRVGNSGKVQGAYVRVFPLPPLSPEKFQATAKSDQLLSYAVMQTILGSGYAAPQDELTEIDYTRKRRAVMGMAVPATIPGPAYKARPLNGIWATAPYLHNGSVPSLYQLLLPPKERLKTFTVGSRVFDSVNVGFKTDAKGFPVYRARNDDGTSVPGNSNDGHDYGGANLTDEERLELVEYLKSL